MAEMDTSSGGGHKKGSGVKKGKKLSTRVDLTPMVDLGFLLITFFIFATTISQPKAAGFRVPNDDVKDDELMKANKDAAMNALIGPDEKRVYYYEGDDPTKIELIDITIDPKDPSFKTKADVRRKIIAKRKTMAQNNIPDSLSILSIKPLEGAKYGTFMKLFDERQINAVKSYVKVKPTQDEINVINAYNASNGLPPVKLPTNSLDPEGTTPSNPDVKQK
jgi:biopolymer transport protein ExbD